MIQRVPLVLNLCGLPGSGKTTIARALLVAVASEGLRGTAVCFDDFIEPACALAVSRPRALETLKELLCSNSVHEGEEGALTFIVVDDNGYYRSMRKEVWHAVQGASSSSWAFMQLYVCVPVELALQRNAQRTGAERVPDSVVLGMGTRLEPPTQKGWDTALVVDESMSTAQTVQAVMDAWLHAKVTTPSQPPPPPPAQPQQSELHSLDLALRREVGRLIKDAPSHQKASLGSKLNDVRKEILNRSSKPSEAEALQALGESCHRLLSAITTQTE